MTSTFITNHCLMNYKKLARTAPAADDSAMRVRKGFSPEAAQMLRIANVMRWCGVCPVMYMLGHLVPIGQHGEIHHVLHRDNNRVDAGIYLSERGHSYYHSLPPAHTDRQRLDHMMMDHSRWIVANHALLLRKVSPLLLSFS